MFEFGVWRRYMGHGVRARLNQRIASGGRPHPAIDLKKKKSVAVDYAYRTVRPMSSQRFSHLSSHLAVGALGLKLCHGTLGLM